MLVNKFPYEKLSRTTTPAGRKYVTSSGDKLPSVTTILAKTKSEKSKKSLSDWRARVGAVKADQITVEAGSRGNRMHSFLEKYIINDSMGDSGTNPYSKESYTMANHVLTNGLHKATEFYGSEVSLYYPELYAGTTDVVGLYKEELAILDFKQSNKPKKDEWVEDYKYQLAGYILAHDKLYETTIPRGVIMMCTPQLVYQEWILEGTELEKYKDLWWEKLYRYYEQLQSGNL